MSKLQGVNGLKVCYGGIEALHGLTSHVEEGEIVTLIGVKGTGKTTKTGLSVRGPPNSGGRYPLLGQEHPGRGLEQSRHRASRLALARGTPHLRQPHRGVKTLKLAIYPCKYPKADITRDYEQAYGLFPRLAERRKQRSKSLSAGEHNLLGLLTLDVRG